MRYLITKGNTKNPCGCGTAAYCSPAVCNPSSPTVSPFAFLGIGHCPLTGPRFGIASHSALTAFAPAYHPASSKPNAYQRVPLSAVWNPLSLHVHCEAHFMSAVRHPGISHCHCPLQIWYCLSLQTHLYVPSAAAMPNHAFAHRISMRLERITVIFCRQKKRGPLY